MSENNRESGRGMLAYIPLIVIVTLTLLAGLARQNAIPGGWSAMSWMHDWMGFFLVVFSMLKLFDLPGFADGFAMYDLLAKRVRTYAYIYPFVELLLGLGFLSRWNPPAVYALTVAVMGFGVLGVLSALKKGLNINCPCMGNVLNVPLSTVTLVEDLGMAVMAATMFVVAW
jgi:hypothetical protein